MSITVKQLAYLRKAVEVGNITQAAKSLNVAQTALGMQIRNLEEDLDVVLLERHSRGVVPTPAGEVLLRYADEVLGLIDDAREAMRRFGGADRGQVVNLGLTPSLMRTVGDDILVDLVHRVPDITLRLVEDFSFLLIRQLQHDELTCALTFSGDIDRKWRSYPLLEEDLFYITAPSLTPPGAETIAFRDILASDLALTGRQDVISQLVGNIAREQGMDLSIAYEVQSIRAVKNLVAKGIAATIMPYGAAEGELRSGTLRARLITSPSVTRTLTFVYPPNRAPLLETPQFRAFVSAIADRMAEKPGPVVRRF